MPNDNSHNLHSTPPHVKRFICWIVMTKRKMKCLLLAALNKYNHSLLNSYFYIVTVSSTSLFIYFLHLLLYLVHYLSTSTYLLVLLVDDVCSQNQTHFRPKNPKTQTQGSILKKVGFCQPWYIYSFFYYRFCSTRVLSPF